MLEPERDLLQESYARIARAVWGELPEESPEEEEQQHSKGP